jgi:hypothetical protein
MSAPAANSSPQSANQLKKQIKNASKRDYDVIIVGAGLAGAFLLALFPM